MRLELDALVGGPDIVQERVGVLAQHVLPVVAGHVVPLHLGDLCKTEENICKLIGQICCRFVTTGGKYLLTHIIVVKVVEERQAGLCGAATWWIRPWRYIIWTSGVIIGIEDVSCVPTC